VLVVGLDVELLAEVVSGVFAVYVLVYLYALISSIAPSSLNKDFTEVSSKPKYLLPYHLPKFCQAESPSLLGLVATN
jgi:hypothetical protein